MANAVQVGDGTNDTEAETEAAQEGRPLTGDAGQQEDRLRPGDAGDAAKDEDPPRQEGAQETAGQSEAARQEGWLRSEKPGSADTTSGGEEAALVPEIDSITPDRASQDGGVRVAIKGHHLAGVTSVAFGDEQVTTFVSKTADEIQVVTPEYASPGNVEVTVRTADGLTSEPFPFQFTES